MFSLIDNAEIEVEAEVIEAALGQVSVNDAVDLTISGIGPVKGTARLIYSVVDPVTRLGSVRIDLGDHALLCTGLFASGWVITDQVRALSVPASAVLTDRDGTFVQVVANAVVERRTIRAGIIWNLRRQIISGLAEGGTSPRRRVRSCATVTE